MELWARLCELITDDDLKAIAWADYGRDFNEHLQALEAIRQRAAFFPITSWFPQEVLELTRWLDVNEQNAMLTAFSSAALLISSFHPKVGLRPQPKGCHRRAPAHLSAYSSGDEAAGGGSPEPPVPWPFTSSFQFHPRKHR